MALRALTLGLVVASALPVFAAATCGPAERQERLVPADTLPTHAPGPASPTDVTPALEAADEPLPVLATPAADAEPPAVETLRAYFDTPALSGALAAYRAGDNKVAAAAFEAFVQDDPDDVRALPARFLALLSHHDAGQWEPTAARLEALADAWPELSDYARFYAASAYSGAGKRDKALAIFATIDSDSTLWRRAQLRRARILESLDRVRDAVTSVEAMLKDHPDARPAAWEYLITLKRSLGDAKGVQEATLQLATRHPKSTQGRTAYQALGTKPRLSAGQRLALGKALGRAHRHQDALNVLTPVSRKDAGYCEAKLVMGRALERQKAYERAWTQFKAGLARCRTGRVYGDLTFNAGRNRLRKGQLKDARTYLSAHARKFPSRTTVDDVELMLARADREDGKPDAADKRILALLAAHPDGDQADDAGWGLVWPRIEEGDHEGALKWLDKVMARRPDEIGRENGRLRYWRGRVLARLGRDEEARQQWRTVLRDHPLSWYGLLAYSRLAAHDAEAAAEQVRQNLASASPPSSPLTRIPAPLWKDPHFRKAVELSRMGLSDSAARELAATPAPEGAHARAWAWTQVVLYQTARAWPQATRLARRHQRRVRSFWPRGEHRRLWELSYPRPYADLVQSWAKTRAIDPHWLWAVMRVESNFNPDAESWANAIGLMQIIVPTATFLAKGTDHEPSRANLKKPAVAIELGSKYLARLLKRHPSLPLASAGYNAGGGAVARWRKRFGDVELDEFVERIPYREARGYAKRVTQALARYRWLYADEHLQLDLTAPGLP